MAFHLTPDMIEGAYRLLVVSPPFRTLGLPDADQVEFHVARFTQYADCYWHGKPLKDGRPVIRVSSRRVGHMDTLIRSAGHEMCHIHLDIHGVRSHHGAEFRKLARAVCRYHGWDPMEFV
jgi:hypothetical protein